MSARTLSIAVLSTFAAAEAQADPIVPGELRSYSTPQSIGVEWDVTGDTDHDAAVAVTYTVAGAGNWQDAMPLFRVDSRGSNMLAGSVLFLLDDTSYEIQLALTDPDGGDETRTITVATAPVPELATGGPTHHVAPGSGGGSGTSGDPWLGIDEALSHASSGDTFLLHAGDYGAGVVLDVGGSGSDWVAWVAAGDGVVHFDGLRVDADRVWVEGVEVVAADNAMRSLGGNTRDVVFKGNTVTGCHYCIHQFDTDEAWWISDNVIVGDAVPASGDLSGEGIELQHSSGHTIAYNSISFVADGVSYPWRNVDIFGNDIFETSDDGIEPDYGLANIRVWGNRIHHAHNNGITFQPMDGGPWYILRNQVIGSNESVLKLRDVTHAFVAHNTFVAHDRVMQSGSGLLRNMMLRNNLFISITGDYIFEDTGTTPADNWRTDLDWDGYAYGSSAVPKFKWFDVRYDDLAAFQSASGQEANGVELPLACFDVDVPGAPPAVIPAQHVTLVSPCDAIDGGVVLPGINDGYVGAAPDLGAHEVGAPDAQYGPRTTSGCGDGRVEGGETCDPPATCPATCSDGDACTTDQLSGDAASCTAECSYVPITTCANGDGCCPAGCDMTGDDDCSPTGGDAAAGGDATGGGDTDTPGGGDADAPGGGAVTGGCGCGASYPTWLLAVVLLRRRRRAV